MTKALSKLNAIYQGVIPYYSQLLTPFFSNHPYWELCFYLAIGLYGAYMALKQDEVNEVLDYINNNQQIFKKETVEKKDFQGGFLLFFEAYLKQRIAKKKQILKNIFSGFSLSNDKENYELERLNDCLVRMTIPTLEFIIFIKNTIVPTLEKQYRNELAGEKHQQSDRSDEWWLNNKLIKVSVNSPIQEWLHKNYSPSTGKVKDDYGIIGEWTPDTEHRAITREIDKRNEVNEIMIELVTLGILRTQVSGGTFSGGGGTDYRLTNFGLEFIKQLDEID